MQVRPFQGRQALAREIRQLRERGRREAQRVADERAAAITRDEAARQEARQRYEALPSAYRAHSEQLAERGRLVRPRAAIAALKAQVQELERLRAEHAAQIAQPPIAITINGQRATAKPPAPARKEIKPTPAEEAESRRFWKMLSVPRALPTPKLRAFRQQIIDGMTECNTTALREIDDAEAAGTLSRVDATQARLELSRAFNQLLIVADRCNGELADRARLRRKGWAPRFLLSAEEKAQLALDEESEPTTAAPSLATELAPRWEGVHFVRGGTLPLMP